MTKKTTNSLRVGLVVPHIFMHRDILPRVIFSPGHLALELANGLQQLGTDVTLFTPGPTLGMVRNSTADLSYFEQELAIRGDSYLELLKKHPFTFITLARQVQGELIAKALAAANAGELDIVHIYTNEEDIALPFEQFCTKPVVFTHHDPYNFLVKYKNVFPKYKHLRWISISNAQRKGMPADTNWVGTIYHGLDESRWQPQYHPAGNYIAYMGRIIEPKGLHLAIAAVKYYNQTASTPLKLKIAGKHYAEHAKDTYWRTKIEPELDDAIEYVGFIDDLDEKQTFLGNARGLIVPSVWQEPFGMVVIEALACATPVIGLGSGAISEIIEDGKTGFVVSPDHSRDEWDPHTLDETKIIQNLAQAIPKLDQLSRYDCRANFEARFTLALMCRSHASLYQQIIAGQATS